MPVLSREQVASYAKGAGFTGDDVAIAVAVALAESGGRTEAHNATPPDDSYGLWQINMLDNLGPDRRKRFGIAKNEQLYDPAINAKAAKIIHADSGWKAWTTYTSGKYKQYMTGDNAPPNTPTPSPNSGGVFGGFNALSDTIFKAASNFTGVIIAVVLLVLGIIILARNVVPAKKLVKAVVK